ncbi:UDP-N-acetylenolpyruvoylglucosamine reductase [Pseudoxanthomonas kalamensis DSM 18571]|uniref:UDP-N-acetylmuramate dehydrogenase n=1 Tax=Pseudoxanthomonas kalamensis TaxID=289483 RepID=UPI001391A6E2|nr:UDP-N-acetylmuramate dehydrogenase [Pseudoxanthomonas kalamensis]KAF1708573.1 UDP-N-acetylenolpyruvoylglucosamine reductase [Pseudoxanthomonas kalamensis DSM 18571]
MSPPWRLTRDAPLRGRNTLHLDATAPWLLELERADALADALALPQLAGRDPLLLGGGSNLLFAGDPDTAVVTFTPAQPQLLHDDGDHAIVRAEAGVPWHALVMWSLQQGLCGLENLALIPGTAGAAPIQNIGAYGMEVGDVVLAVEAWDRATSELVRFDREACRFGYRDSLFKQQPGRHILTALELRLPRHAVPKLGYAGIGEELSAMNIDAPTAADVAEAVIRIRSRKLPDPHRIGNAGSFFKNPIVPLAQAEALQAGFPRLPAFRGDSDDTRKLSAAWMIEACGWKGRRDGDAGVSADHALVLVNHGHARGAQILTLARRIAASVEQRFGVRLEPEPRIIGDSW